MMDRSSFDGTGISIRHFLLRFPHQKMDSHSHERVQDNWPTLMGFLGIRRRWDPCVARRAFRSSASSHFVPPADTSSCNKCPLYPFTCIISSITKCSRHVQYPSWVWATLTEPLLHFHLSSEKEPQGSKFSIQLPAVPLQSIRTRSQNIERRQVTTKNFPLLH